MAKAVKQKQQDVGKTGLLTLEALMHFGYPNAVQSQTSKSTIFQPIWKELTWNEVLYLPGAVWGSGSWPCW